MRWAEDFGGSKETHAQAMDKPPTPRAQAPLQREEEEDELMSAAFPFTSEEETELLAMLEHRLGGALSSDEEDGDGDEEVHAGQVLDDARVTTLANLLHAKHLTHQWLKVRRQECVGLQC
jgi:hypothetical protein